MEERGEPLLLPQPSRLAVRDPAPVSRVPGSASGACFAVSRSPRPPPFAPPTPPRPNAALFAGFIATMAGSDFSRPCIIGFGSSPSRCGPRPLVAARPGARSPGSRARSVHACQGLRPRRAGPPLAMARRTVLPSTQLTVSAPGTSDFRGSMAGLHVPLPTLHPCPRGRRCTARGRRGSLLLRRIGLAPTTPCRSPGALIAQPRFEPHFAG